MSLQTPSAAELRCDRAPLGAGAPSFVRHLLVCRPWHTACYRLMIKRNVRLVVVPHRSFDPLWDPREIFEIDRSNVVLQLRTLRRAIDEGAQDMEMVAAERVFTKSLSRTLTRRARKLHLIAKDLNGLLRLVERSHAEKPPARPAPKSKRSSPRSARIVERDPRAERTKAMATG
jgi:hypothetical protein